ncbi:MAG: hypothetical protein ACI9UN_003589 [Granulosicoccus sp.]|jgi:hypothetical protein
MPLLTNMHVESTRLHVMSIKWNNFDTLGVYVYWMYMSSLYVEKTTLNRHEGVIMFKNNSLCADYFNSYVNQGLILGRPIV